MNFQRIVAVGALLLTTALPIAASARPVVLESGTFHSGAHATSGKATVYQLDNGTKLLRLTNFETSNGPKVHVVLADHIIKGNDVVNGRSVDFGDLKGTTGNQNYVIPAGTDIAAIKSVSIYCERFHVNFGTARIK